MSDDRVRRRADVLVPGQDSFLKMITPLRSTMMPRGRWQRARGDWVSADGWQSRKYAPLKKIGKQPDILYIYMYRSIHFMRRFKAIVRHCQNRLSTGVLCLFGWQWQKSFVSSNYDNIGVSCQINIIAIVVARVCVCVRMRNAPSEDLVEHKNIFLALFKGNYFIILWHFSC